MVARQNFGNSDALTSGPISRSWPSRHPRLIVEQVSNLLARRSVMPFHFRFGVGLLTQPRNRPKVSARPHSVQQRVTVLVLQETCVARRGSVRRPATTALA